MSDGVEEIFITLEWEIYGSLSMLRCPGVRKVNQYSFLATKCYVTLLCNFGEVVACGKIQPFSYQKQYIDI